MGQETYTLTKAFKDWRDSTLENQQFIEKWAERLKTSKQATGRLADSSVEDEPVHRCCLGVACHLAGISDKDMERVGLPGDVVLRDRPERLEIPKRLQNLLVAELDGFEEVTTFGFMYLNDYIMTHAEISTLLTEGTVTVTPHNGDLP